jgi:Tfp pilus assembly protein PilF
LRQRREYDAAIARYREALLLAPEDGRARTGLGETQEAKRRAEEALIRLGGSSPQTEATAQLFVENALKAMKAGDDAAAQKALEEALRVDPRNEGAQKLLKVLTGR